MSSDKSDDTEQRKDEYFLLEHVCGRRFDTIEEKVKEVHDAFKNGIRTTVIRLEGDIKAVKRLLWAVFAFMGTTAAGFIVYLLEKLAET